MRALLLLALLACKDAADKPAPTTPTPTTPTTPTTTTTAAVPPATPTDLNAPPTNSNALPTDLVKGANQFALALWKHVPAGNAAISPASLAIPLTILWGGAKGETAAQLHGLLGLPAGPQDIVLGRWGNLAKSLSDGSRPVTLKIANRIYGEKTYDIDTTYFTIARHAFDVRIEPVDFVSSFEEVRASINTWVAEVTEQRIKDLLPPRALNAATKLVIVNAIYFLADWATPFDKANTQPREFFLNGKVAARVPTMLAQERFRYAKTDGAALVELPYKGDSLAMYVVVPDARDGLAALEAKLEPALRALQGKLAEREVVLTLPRFTVDPAAPLELSRALQALGVKDAFDPAVADLTGIANPKNARERLFVSTVLHKTFVKVDEQGTEAAAATAIGAASGGPPPKPTELRVDHPFMFVIVDKTSGLILFIGRVVDPK